MSQTQPPYPPQQPPQQHPQPPQQQHPQHPQPTPYSTPPANVKDTPAHRRSKEETVKLRSVAESLEALHVRIAHTLSADDLAVMASAVSELKAMYPADPAA
jgi:hypothetical protein